MKRLIIIVVCASAIAGCASLERARTVTGGFADYRPYTTAGFFISPDPYPGDDYTAIGEYRASVLPAWKMGENRLYKAETITAAELLQMTVEEARKKGANGIVDYRVNITRSASTWVVESYDISALFILIHEVEIND